MKKQILGSYRGNKLIVNGLDVNSVLSNSEYKVYSKLVNSAVNYNDKVELLHNNQLYSLIDKYKVDFNLYKALSSVMTFRLNWDDIHRSRISTDLIRYNNLKNTFKLWYNKSNDKLTFTTLKRVLNLIKVKTNVAQYKLTQV